jgi:hypothetical protein
MKTEERPVTRDDGEALIAQIRQAVASGADRATINFGSQQLVLESDTSGDLTLRTPARAATTRVYLETFSRPGSYPSDLPFVSGEPCTVSEEREVTAVFWWVPQDADSLLEQLRHECLSDGWTVEDDRRTEAPPSRLQTYEKGGLRRRLQSSFGFVTMVQRTPHATAR